MNLTVDASVVIKWFVAETLFEQARLLLSDSFDLHAPDILLAEFANTIWKKFRRGEISDSIGRIRPSCQLWARSSRCIPSTIW